MKLFNTLRFRLMIILLCVALIPLVSMALFQYNQFDAATADNIRKQEIELASVNADKIESWLNSKASQLTESLKAHPEFKNMDLAFIRSVIKYIDENDVEVTSTIVADKNGSSGVITVGKPQSILAKENILLRQEIQKALRLVI